MTSARNMHRIVHLDLKGLPPSPQRLLELPELFASLGLTGILIEYEDTFPFRCVPEMKAPYTYSLETLREFLARAQRQNIQVIPLIQTFGHLESLLKHQAYHSLRELPNDPRALCPLNPNGRKLISQMIREIVELHQEFDLQYVHLGADEVFTLGSCPKCEQFVKQHSKAQLYLNHLNPLLDQINAQGLRALIWHDMLRGWSLDQLKPLADRAELMFWNYGWVPQEVEAFCSPEDIAACQSIGIDCWASAAFRGADGCDRTVPDIFNRGRNTLYWTQQAINKNFKGVCLTGWSRYMSTWACCEPLEGSWESLAVCSQILQTGHFDYPKILEQTRKQLYGISDPTRQPCQKNESLWTLQQSLCQLESWCQSFDLEHIDRMKVQFPRLWNENRSNAYDAQDRQTCYENLIEQFPDIAEHIQKDYQGLALDSEIRYFLQSRIIPRKKIWNLLKSSFLT